ncbi:MAG TPA: cytochrome P450 [Streptosporangiaceae bacterium]|nr:cytochrome P450 [Streptosporangiaceae bacterium]
MTGDLMRQVTDPASRHDPYPLYARLRENRVNLLADGSYALGRYEDVVGLLHDPRISSDPHNASDPGSAKLLDDAPFIQRDPPDHGRLRAIAMRYFGPPISPGVVSGQEPEIRGFVDSLVDSLPRSGEADLVDHLAYPLPVSVICGLLGVPKEDEPQFRGWTEDIVKGIDAQEQQGADALVRQRDQSEAAMFVYVTNLVGKHRMHPDGSVLSHLANDDAVDVMTDVELGVTSLLLLVAGHETTVNLTANGMLTLLRNRWALERLRGEPDWAIPLVEELLRFEPPVQYLPNRVARTDIEVGGTTIPQGARVILLLAAASRDPERFPHPDRFDPDRGYNQHLGFGSGLHYCFGAPLARIEAYRSLTTFARRLANPRLAADPPPYRPSPVLRGPIHLPVAYDELLPCSRTEQGER